MPRVITFLFVIVGLSLLGLLLLADHVKNRFRHTPSSRRVLAMEAGLAAAVSAVCAALIWPDYSLAARVALGALIAVPLYIVLAFLTVEAWRHRKQEGFDREIARLARECGRWQEEVERLNWELKDLERQKASREEEGVRLAARQRALEDQVQAWVQAEAGPQRARQVEMWTAALAAMNDGELQGQKERLLAQATHAADEDKAELVARVHLIDLLLLRRVYTGPAAPLVEMEQRLIQIREARARADRRLAQAREELQRWQDRKAAFLREKIPLD